jgi:CheY-like chemotaxis protein
LTAQSGEEALDVYKKQNQEIDLVIMDMIMPGMGGGEAFDKIKEIDEDVSVLLSSGYSINGHAQEIIDQGCRGFIQKPFSLNDLSIKIRETLGDTRNSDDL